MEFWLENECFLVGKEFSVSSVSSNSGCELDFGDGRKGEEVGYTVNSGYCRLRGGVVLGRVLGSL